MKRKMLILCSLITLLLAAFQFPIYAEEDPTDPPSSVPVPNSIRLDQYFYDNYDLLPYIEGKSSEYIDTNINPSNNLRINMSFSDLSGDGTYLGLFGSSNGQLSYAARYTLSSDSSFWNFDNQSYTYEYEFVPYYIYNLSFDKNNVYLNNVNIHSFSDSVYSIDYPIFIFSRNQSGSASPRGHFKLYSFDIYDYDSESYLRYFYPARSKSGGVVGLYDAVSDTFFTSLGSAQFTSPVQDQVLNFRIGTFLTSSIVWITDILEFAIETPIILIFMAISLAGAMFRWGRKLVHF